MSTNDVAPATPSIMGLIDHSVSNYADFSYGSTLHDDAPGIVFTTIPGATYSMYDNGALIGTMVATKTNTNWTVPSVLFNGAHELTLMATDAAGNNSAQASINFTVAAGPAAPAYLGLIDHSVSNYAEADIAQVTHDAHPSLVLSATVGDTLNLFDNGQLVGTMVVTQANTKWDLPTLSNGVHNLSITETNASGTSVPLFLQMTVDAPAATPSVISLMATAVDATPATPAIMGLIDHSVSNYADFSYGSTLHDDAPGIVFTTIPGATYSMYDNGALIGTMVATKTNTNWTVPSVLFNGAHELTLMATDAAGNNSAQASINFTVAAGPAAPAYLGLVDHSVSNYAEADIAQVTHDAHPSLVLSATVGDTLNLFDNGQLVGTMVVTQANTKWDLPTLSNGVHNLSITETNASGTSVPLFLQMTVDAPAATPSVISLMATAVDATPATPAIMGLIDHSVSNYADFSYGSTLHDDAPGIVFTTIPGATYSMYDNGALIGTMVATKTNTNWTVPSVLFNGAHELTLMATDAAGNNSAQASINFTVAAGPAAPAYLGLVDHSVSNYAEADIAQVTHDAHPSLVLSATVGDTLNLFDNGQLVGTMVVTQANTKWDLPTLSNGVHNLSITETNASGTSVPLFLQMTVDAPAATPSVISLMATAVDATPATPAIMGLIDHSVSNYADFSYGSTLHDDAPGIVFTTIPGATYSMYDNGALIGTMVATKTNTNWTVPSVLFNGAHELTLMATDAAGNNSAQASINFTVAAGPAAPAYLGLVDHSVSNYAEADIAQVTHDAHPSLVLSATVGDTLNLFDNGQLVGTMVVTQANTKWDLPTLSNGVHNLSITETNASGTSVPLFLQMTVDAPAATPSVISLMATAVDATPATPAIMGLIDHSVSNYADFSYGSTLHDDAPGIVFTTIPGATYSMYDNGALIGTMVATKTNTNWTVPSVLFNGAHELTLMATDAAGNNSAQASINFTVAAGPAAPAYLGLVDHSVSNYAEADIAQVTHDAHPSLVLSATVGDTLNLFDNGQLVGTMVVTQANTKWDLPTLSNGVHNLSITETNASGTSVPLFLQMTVDAPAAPAVQSLVSAAHAVSQDVTAVSNDASVGLRDKFVASAGHQNVDLNVDPNSPCVTLVVASEFS